LHHHWRQRSACGFALADAARAAIRFDSARASCIACADPCYCAFASGCARGPSLTAEVSACSPHPGDPSGLARRSRACA